MEVGGRQAEVNRWALQKGREYHLGNVIDEIALAARIDLMDQMASISVARKMRNACYPCQYLSQNGVES